MAEVTLTKHKHLFSFEVFPPKQTQELTIEPILAELAKLAPDYMSVTLGAGGNGALQKNTLNIASLIQSTYRVPAVAHLPAVGFSRDEMGDFLDLLAGRGITRVLALRGDRAPNNRLRDGFCYAVDLVKFVVLRGGFSIGAACYPETHLEALSPQRDLLYLKEKVQAGVDHLITQLFFDNQRFFDFINKTQQIGINVPIQAGIMPITNERQIKRIVALTQVHFPAKLTTLFNRYADDEASLRAAGIDYTVEQIQGLQQSGVAGIHLYTMNDPKVAKQIYVQSKPLDMPTDMPTLHRA